MTIQFSGESDWDAIVNHNSLDIVEEERFIEYIVSMGWDPNITKLHALEILFGAWNRTARDPKGETE